MWKTFQFLPIIKAVATFNFFNLHGGNRMKKLALMLLIVTLSLLCAPSFAQNKDVQERLVDKQIEYNCFDTLLKRTEVNVTALSAVTPSDTTATGAAAVAYLPDSYRLPILLRVQNLSADDILYETYATVGTAGVTLPTASSPILVNKDGQISDSGEFPFEKIFYTAPTQVFSAASNTSSLVIEVWGRSGDQ